MLKSVTEGRDADNLDSLSRKRIEDLGRYVDPVQPSLLIITRSIRTVRHIESVVSERANCARDSRENRAELTKECLVAWRTEIQRAFDIPDPQLTEATVSKQLQGGLACGDALDISEIKQRVHRFATTSASVLVRMLLTPLCHSPLTIYHVAQVGATR